MDIVQNILDIAKKKKVNDQQLCRVLHTNTSKIYDWKIGKSKPSAKDLAVLSEYFDVSTDYLIGLTDIPQREDMMEGDAGFRLINRFYKDADSAGRKKMIQLLQLSFGELFDGEEDE